MMQKIVVGSLLASASAIRVEQQVSHDHIASKTMHMYRKDCWKSRPVSSHMSFVEETIPGAGIVNVTAFETVLKDGFYQVECVKDSMFTSGDKFGDNRHSYSIGDSAGVSIVLYEKHVKKMDREEMTHAVCFNFCRTVPDMLFFGITNGRECYCAPYYKPEASDSSQCDATCEGNPSMMCGGKSKSDVFQMHMCANTAGDLSGAKSDMGELKASVDALATQAKQLGTDMQDMGKTGQDQFGKAGDPEASNLFQSAKVFAGDLTHGAEAGEKVVTKMSGLNTSVIALDGADFTKPAKVTEAEDLIDGMDTANSDGNAAAADLEDLVALAAPPDTANNSKAYYNVMYFVDKEFQESPSTCAGDSVKKPLVASKDGCAAACDADVHDCVGFSHFDGLKTGKGLCFLFSKFTSATYYTKCDGTSDVTAKCMAKLSKFEGTTLKPNPSGKCDQCLKKATKAARCY